MDVSVNRLTRQIPQHGLALRSVFAYTTKLRNDPELLTVCGGVLLELAMRQPPAQPRFSHARIADENEFSSGIVDALLRLAAQERFVQLPDANDGVFFSQRRQHGKPGV